MHTTDVDVDVDVDVDLDLVDDDGGGRWGSDINLVHTGEKRASKWPKLPNVPLPR